MDKVAILFNPSSGRGLSLRKKDDIKDWLKNNSISFNWYNSKSELHLRRLAREKAGSFQVIMVVGGDTSFQIVASEIFKSHYNPALCMVPTGSANDIALSLGFKSIKCILESIKDLKTRMMDIGLLEIKGIPEKIYFVGSVSLGLGVSINKFVSRYWKRHAFQAKLGKLFQIMAGFLGAKDSFKQKKIPFRVRLSSETFDHDLKFSIIVFSNVPSYAGGLKICPKTSPFDGKINVCNINTTSLANTTQLAYSVWRQKHHKKSEVQFFGGKSFVVFSENPINLQYDGKVISGVREFRISVLPSAIKVLV